MGIALTSGAVGAPITAAMYNQLVASFSPPIVRLTKSSAQSTSGTPGTNSAVVWDVETYDDYGMHDNTTNNTRITIPAGWGGYYSATARVRANTSSATLTIQFAVNGVNVGTSSIVTLGNATINPFSGTTDDLLLLAGDYVEVWIQSNTGGISLVPGSCAFAMKFVHP